MDYFWFIMILLTAFCKLIDCTSTYTFDVRVHKYRNSGHKLASGNCCDTPRKTSGCDPWWCLHCQCDNRFRFCFRHLGAPHDGRQYSCPLGGGYTTGKIGDESDSFNFGNKIGRLSNPFGFSGSQWPGGFQLLIVVHDVDIDPDDLVDRIYVDMALSPSSSFTASQFYSGENGRSRMELSFRIRCKTDFYDANCTTYCRRTDNDLGHFECGINGEKICLGGWTNITNNCLTPVCSDGCHRLGGFCEVPGECSCKSGWNGTNCSQCISTAAGCSPVGGYCNVPDECICRNGYSGANCTIDLLPCERRSPCLINTSLACTNDNKGGYACSCVPGYEGVLCEREINECDSSPCHFGMCQDKVNGFECVCEIGYTGTTCDQNVDDCVTVSCQNGGTCSDGINNYTCSCVAGYSGDHCEINIDDCSPNPCHNNGTCLDLVNGFFCNCTSGHFGMLCEVETNHCDPNPCNSTGICYSRTNGSECVCVDGYTGDSCETEVNECELDPCAHGNCTDLVADYNCTCDSGWTGRDCNENIDDCLSNLCANGATCIDGISSYNCSCAAGWEGEFCSVNTDDCVSRLCQNNGTCQDLVNGFLCECTEGYVGIYCETDNDDCLSSPCENVGTCSDRVNGYQCTCTAGWTGERCEVDIDDCQTSPCSNRGSCYDLLNDFVCVCVDGWMGRECQEEINECEENPCLNNATCQDVFNGYRCVCPVSYVGPTCAVEIDYCAAEPCENGGNCTSVKALGSFTCDCPNEFEGDSCEVDMNMCRSSPCQSNGSCANLPGEYMCNCTAGYIGNDCSDVDYCLNATCLAGICFNMEKNFSCLCPDNSIGVTCPQGNTMSRFQLGESLSGYIAGGVTGGVAICMVLLLPVFIVAVWSLRWNKKKPQSARHVIPLQCVMTDDISSTSPLNVPFLPPDPPQRKKASVKVPAKKRLEKKRDNSEEADDPLYESVDEVEQYKSSKYLIVP